MSPTGPPRWPVKVLPLSKSTTTASWAELVRFTHWLCHSFPRIWHSITFLRAHSSFLHSCIHRVRNRLRRTESLSKWVPIPSTRGPTTYLCSQKWPQALNSVGTSPSVPEQSPVPAPRPNTHKTLFSPVIPITVSILDLKDGVVPLQIFCSCKMYCANITSGPGRNGSWVCEVPYCLFL